MASQGDKRVVEAYDLFIELPHKLNGTGGNTLRLDACEIGGLIEVTAEVPGVAESAIEVSIDRDILTISIDKTNGSAGKTVHFSERSFGRFERSIQLPFVPNPDSVEAAAENGVLTIRFPRVDGQRTRRIALRGAQLEPQEEERNEEVAAAIGSDWDHVMPGTTRPVTVDVTATRLG